MDAIVKVIIIGITIILSILAFWYGYNITPSYLPNNMDKVSTSMQWIGKALASGQIYCVDNVGIDLVENGTKRWVSMKELCEVIT